jgi:hypothetical protein
MTGVMTGSATRPDRPRALSTTGSDARLFMTAYAAGFVFLFVLLG